MEPEEVDTLSSVSPSSLLKVTFVLLPFLRGFPRSDIDWEILDGLLCWLCDRLGRERVLEVEFRLMDPGIIGVDERPIGLKIVNSLAKFRERGRMRVAWERSDGSESATYASDCVM